jgi:glycine cleavage system H protein
LGVGVGLGYVDAALAQQNLEVEIDIRGRRFSATFEKKTAREESVLVPDDLKYTVTHEWIRVNGEIGTVGITDFAQHAIQDIVHVELPHVGVQCQREEAVAKVESVKTVSDIHAPSAGKVIETNAAVANDPHLVNTDPYGEGWLFKLKLTVFWDLNTLFDPVGYRAYTREHN